MTDFRLGPDATASTVRAGLGQTVHAAANAARISAIRADTPKCLEGIRDS